MQSCGNTVVLLVCGYADVTDYFAKARLSPADHQENSV